ncbi:hypothetical protein ACFLU6_15725, partial [Acidobacteriota bacterium]
VPGCVYLAVAYGRTAFEQLAVFNAFKAAVCAGPTFVGRLDVMSRTGLPWLLAAGLAGLLWRGNWKEDVLGSALFAYFVLALSFYFFVSDTLWAHNVIDLLLPSIVGFANLLFRIERRLCRFAALGEIRGAQLAVILVLLLATGFGNRVDGWGYVKRESVRQVTGFVAENSATSDIIAAPGYIATEAGRRTLVDFPECCGVYLAVRKMNREELLVSARGTTYETWENLVASSRAPLRELAVGAIEDGTLKAVVWDSVYPEARFDPTASPELEIKDGLLSRHGFEVGLVSDGYVVWIRRPAEASPVPDTTGELTED